MSKRFWCRPGPIVGMLAAVGMLTAVACGAAEEPTPTPTRVAPAATPTPTRVVATPTPTTVPTPVVAAPAGRVVIVGNREPTKMGLLHRLGGEAFYTDSTGDLLVRTNPATGAIEGQLALRWEQVAPDRWRFFLRQGVKFHNGEPFNARTAIWSIATQTRADSGARIVRYAKDLKGEAVDDYTLDIICPTACPILLSVLYHMQFAPPAWSQANPDDSQRYPVGTGPYKFDEWRLGEYVRESYFPEYWGPRPAIAEALFLWRTEPLVRAAMVQVGEAHLADDLDLGMEKQVPKLAVTDSPNTTAVRLRARMDLVWEDVRLRQALAYAIDCQAIVKTLFGSKVVCRKLPFHESTVGYPKGIVGYPYNPDKARQLLKEAGAEGLEFTMYGTAGGATEPPEAVMGYWQAIGLRPTLTWVEGEFRDRQHRPGVGKMPPPAMWFPGHTNDIFDASATIIYWDGCTEPRSYSPCDQAISAKIKAASSASGAERARLFEELMTIWNDQVVMISLWSDPFVFGVAKNLEWQPRFDDLIRVDMMRFTQ